MQDQQFTIRRLMLEVIFVAVLLGPVGWLARQPRGAIVEPIAWALVLGWVGMLLLFRWVYRDFRNPFG